MILTSKLQHLHYYNIISYEKTIIYIILRALQCLCVLKNIEE